MRTTAAPLLKGEGKERQWELMHELQKCCVAGATDNDKEQLLQLVSPENGSFFDYSKLIAAIDEHIGLVSNLNKS